MPKLLKESNEKCSDILQRLRLLYFVLNGEEQRGMLKKLKKTMFWSKVI